MYPQALDSVSITTAADGSGTGYLAAARGRVLAFTYTKSTYDDGVGFTVINERTGETVLAASSNSTATWFPLQQPHNAADGSAMTYDGTRKVGVPALLCGDRLKIVVASGGNVKAGSFSAVVG